MELDPKDKTVLNNRAYTYLRSAKYAQAINDYDAAIRLQPRSPKSLFGRAVAYAALGKNDLAKADLAVARAADPGIDKEMAIIHLTAPAGL